MKNLVISRTARIHDAFSLMSDIGEKCLVVIDQGNRVIGTLSDGDLRRGILSGKKLEEPIDELYFQSPTVLEQGAYSRRDLKGLFLEHRFEVIPVVDQSGTLVEVHTWDQVLNDGEVVEVGCCDLPLIIMAGGRGTRLEPFTNVLPKPLVPVGGKPVIEHIIERFTRFGVKDIYLSINYKSRILRAFFEEGEREYNVTFVEEPKPLGTAGSLQILAGQIAKPFLVTNCDVLIDLDLEDLEKCHRERKNAATIVASAKKFVVPYGQCVLDEMGNLASIEEKPEHNYLVNTGLYLLEPEVLDLIELEEFIHLTTLLERVRDNRSKVGVYPIGENSWIDVGQWPEYRKAVELFR